MDTRTRESELRGIVNPGIRLNCNRLPIAKVSDTALKFRTMGVACILWSTHGGCAYGIPRNTSALPLCTPINVPLSSFTVGAFLGIVAAREDAIPMKVTSS